MAKVLKNHTGEPHRLEIFLSDSGINYINDSKATNISATISALKSLEEPLILILGGLTKEQNFNLLADALNLRSVKLIVFGDNVKSICESFKNFSLCYKKVNSLKDAVCLANKIAKSEILLLHKKNIQINVLLSPACSSLDTYKNYQHRGDEFKKLVSSGLHGEKTC